MGIFSKPPKKDKLKVEKRGKVKAITGELPEGFDVSDPTQVRQLIIDALKEAGELPEGVDLEKADLKLVTTSGEVRIKQEVDLGKLKAAVAQLKEMEGHVTPALPLPQDQAKASFVTCLNRLHAHVHQVAPLVADLYNSLDCLKMSLDASKPSPKERARFDGFVAGITKMVKDVCDFGSEVCEFSQKVHDRGIPAPDATSTTVN